MGYPTSKIIIDEKDPQFVKTPPYGTAQLFLQNGVLSSKKADGTVSSTAGDWAASAGVAGVVPAYLGQVATRSFAPNKNLPTVRATNSQSYHIAQDNISVMQVEYANWYAESTSTFEKLPAATPTYTVYVQYPIGSNWQRFQWGGANSYTFADGETKLSDALKLVAMIPRGAMFLLGVHCDTPNGLVTYNYANQSYTAANNKQAVAYQVLDASTTPGARTDVFVGTNTLLTNGAYVGDIIMPTAIVSQTIRPSILFVGNSRDYGSRSDAAVEVDGSGNTGQVAQVLGKTFGYINVAISGDSLVNALTAYTKRLAQAKYCTHVVGWDMINDLNGSRTPAQMRSDMITLMARTEIVGKKFLPVTTYPQSTSSDIWVTEANQTVVANNANRIVFNSMIRSGQIPGLAGFFDIAAGVENDINGGKFAVDNGAAITIDGLHCNYRGYQRIARSLNTSLI